MGTIISVMGQSFPSKSKLSVTDIIPDLTKQVGVGKETAKALLAHNAKVYIAARSPDKARKAIENLRSQTGRQARFFCLDLADLKSIKRATEEFNQKETELHVLFDSGFPPVEQLTAQDYDLQFGTNVIGHFYLTKLLLPTLLSTAMAQPVRAINTSSSVADLFGRSINFATITNGPARAKIGTNTLYGQGKFGNIVFSAELVRKYAGKGLVSVALNPGHLRTELQRNMSSRVRKISTLDAFLYPVSLTQLWAGTIKEGATMGGKYLIPWAGIGAELWDWLEK
ncbi:NAD(P)-binding protein [Mycena crocata]|nr:NAD(P)-binding protein [Mycena crocata]